MLAIPKFYYLIISTSSGDTDTEDDAPAGVAFNVVSSPSTQAIATPGEPVELGDDDIEEYQKAVCYFREFLAKGHSELGRDGPTCPFVYVQLRCRCLWWWCCWWCCCCCCCFVYFWESLD